MRDKITDAEFTVVEDPNPELRQPIQSPRPQTLWQRIFWPGWWIGPLMAAGIALAHALAYPS